MFFCMRICASWGSAATRSAAIFVAFFCAGSGVRAEETEVRLIHRPDKTFEVSGAFNVQASSTVVWNVLTDYDRIPTFVTSMRSSHIRDAQTNGAVIVEQKAIGDMFFLTRTVRVVLEIHRNSERLLFKDIGQKDFLIYDGEWEVRTSQEGMRVSYRLRAQPRFLAPSFLLSGAMKRGARNLLNQVRAEIIRRDRPR